METYGKKHLNIHKIYLATRNRNKKTMRLRNKALNKVIVNDDFPSILKRTILMKTIAMRTITFSRNCSRTLYVCVLDVSFLSTCPSKDIPAKCCASRYDDKKYNYHG